MLYVFNVDTGTMVTFDMSFAIESVNYLQEQIQKTCKIDVEHQVLLVSGGESLDRNARVCSYSAGTDTNPIYLFSRTDIESKIPPAPSVEIGSNIDFATKVKESHDMPATYNTVSQRAQLAQQFYDSGREELKICQNLVHEQHLQQQGWAAVIANLEDNIVSFTKRSEIFQKGFEDYMNERESYLKFLEHFHEDLDTLSKIPMLPVLLQLENQNYSSDSHSTTTSTESELPKTKCTTLLDWISSTDSKSTTDQIFEHCSRVLEQYDTKIFNSLHTVLKNIFFEASKDEMKDIKGLSDRLCGLEQLMFEAKRYVKEQGDLAQSFIQNQNRASNIGDTSILPDLCASHRKQLMVMLTNHQQLTDIRRRCIKAKSELGTNLHHRLKWVMYMENLMVKIDQQMIVYHESLRRMRTHLEVLQQIHLAPATYLSAVAEVVRRRAFSQAFLSWGSELACYLLTIHNDEITRRKEFQSSFEHHFLSSLFPGMEDVPPSFAIEAPSIFDSGLPKLTIEDLEQLKCDLPDLSENINIPDITCINNLFLVKSIVKTDLEKGDERGVEEKIVQVVNEVGLGSNLDHNLLKPSENEPNAPIHGIPFLKDLDKGCESETDTEEFEKVGQSPLDLHFEKDLSSPRPRTHDASTLTEDNLQTSQTERDRLKDLVLKMAVVAKQAVDLLRIELKEFKSFVYLMRSGMEGQYESLSSSWETLTVELDNKEKEIVQKITTDHEIEMNDCKKENDIISQEVTSLKNHIASLERSLLNSTEEISSLKETLNQLKEDHEKEKMNLQAELVDSRIDKEQSIQKIKETLNREHKAEIESMRSRFRLMSFSKIDRSPSDPNLDKVERTENKETNQHEAIILQIKQNCEFEKEKAINAAIIQESRKWETIFNEKLEEVKLKFEIEKEIALDDVTKKVIEEKEKQIDLLRERENTLNLECIKYKNTIQKLADSEGGSQNIELLKKVESLERKNSELQMQISISKPKPLQLDESTYDLGLSVAICEGKVNAATSPIKPISKLTKSEVSLVKSSKLSIDSCHAGDLVLILWDPSYKNYRIIQESSHLYFLHSDCLETLDLNIKSREDRKPYYTGEVIEKDYCHAKKVGNRYNVPIGTKFFRVKVKPYSFAKELKENKEKSQMSQSEIAGPSAIEHSVTDTTVSWSSPATPIKHSPEETLNQPEPETQSSTTERKTEVRWTSVKEKKAFNTLLESSGALEVDKWKLYKIKRRFYETDDLRLARAKEKLLETNSDLASEEDREVVVTRHKRKPARYISESESDEEDTVETHSSFKILPNTSNASLSREPEIEIVAFLSTLKEQNDQIINQNNNILKLLQQNNQINVGRIRDEPRELDMPVSLPINNDETLKILENYLKVLNNANNLIL
ncbi:hypothetical protein RN001_008819 [Aquatica leii]|uniref:RB1-inducible coiled-coil protein 1 n=1 Tax=Aquatica leii TaxID=1421715 RepID=A0AAN7PB55_9COLE|nr:hypothetical protein RN001_008819 [Aquatica leii]